jgi:hypothetical protein
MQVVKAGDCRLGAVVRWRGADYVVRGLCLGYTVMGLEVGGYVEEVAVGDWEVVEVVG